MPSSIRRSTERLCRGRSRICTGLSTSFGYHPSFYGDQQHIWHLLLDGGVSVFTTHSAVLATEKPPFGNSPGYWVGNGRLPHSAQYRNINMTLYILPFFKNPISYIEKCLYRFTHAWFPSAKFDSFVLEDNYVFASRGDLFIAMISKEALAFADADKCDLKQNGRVSWWITEVSTISDEGSFEDFIKRIKSNTTRYCMGKLEYTSRGDTLRMKFKKSFTVNGRSFGPDERRLSGTYGSINKKPDSVSLSFKGSQLSLDFEKGVRTENPSRA